jgi:hypothetical protein
MDKYNSNIARIFGFFNKQKLYAITLGQTAYYSCDEALVTPRWRSHENQHKVQWARDGKVKFLARYFWQLCTVGYEKIDYEADARQTANNI